MEEIILSSHKNSMNGLSRVAVPKKFTDRQWTESDQNTSIAQVSLKIPVLKSYFWYACQLYNYKVILNFLFNRQSTVLIWQIPPKVPQILSSRQKRKNISWIHNRYRVTLLYLSFDRSMAWHFPLLLLIIALTWFIDLCVSMEHI